MALNTLTCCVKDGDGKSRSYPMQKTIKTTQPIATPGEASSPDPEESTTYTITTTDIGGFNYLYKYITAQFSKVTILANVVNTEWNVYATQITNSAKSYYTSWISGSESGSNAITINNKPSTVTQKLFESLSLYAPANKLPANSVLTNCVGFVNGRMKEIWEIAKKSGEIVKDTTVNKYRFKDAAEGAYIEGDMDGLTYPSTKASWWCYQWPGNTEVRNFDANHQFNTVPPKNGFKIIKGDDLKTTQILPGDVLSWYPINGDMPGAGDTTDRKPGHVAFVEAIGYDEQRGEYVIVSESAFGVHSWVARLTKKYRINNSLSDAEQNARGPYNYGGKRLKAILRSPLCQLAKYSNFTGYLDGKFFSKGSITIDTQEELTEAAINSLKATVNALNGISSKAINISSWVEIKWVGHKEPNEESKKINVITRTETPEGSGNYVGTRGYVKEIDNEWYHVVGSSTGPDYGWYQIKYLKQI